MTKLKCTRLMFGDYDRIVTAEFENVTKIMKEHSPIRFRGC